jgi:N-acetylneuraminic acid mutarotase
MYRKFLRFNLFLFSLLFFINHSLLAQGNTWDSTKTEMPTARYSHGTCAVNGKIYAIGGETTGNGCNSPATQKVEEFNPSTDSWDTTKTDMPMARESFSIGAVNGKIYVIGGSSISCSNHTSTVQEYDPQTDTWDTNKNLMPTARSGLSASVVNGKIYVIGGYRYSPYLPLNNVEEYDPQTDTWDTKAPMLTARGWFNTCVVDGKIYAFGGHDSVLNVEVYDPVTDSWTPKANMPDTLTIYSASSVNGKIYIFGGVKIFTLNGPAPVSNVWEYDPISGTYSPMSPMPTARAAAHASEVNGKIYVIGGSITNHHLQPGNKVEEYTPPGGIGSVEDPFSGDNNPTQFMLHQNYPNPFNPNTTIEFSIPKTEFVTLKIYNMLGKEVSTLVSEKLNTGSYTYSWDASSLASGVYMYRIEAGEFQQVKKMILLK